MAFGIDDAIGAGLSIINKLIPDANARQAAAEDLRKAMMDAAAKSESDQRDINKVEAGNTSMFVAGWRPAVGWLCVLTLAYSWVLAPLVTWGIAVVAVTTGHDIGKIAGLPVLGAADSQTLLYALLGIGGLRTIDKLGGNDTKSVGGVKGVLAGIFGR